MRSASDIAAEMDQGLNALFQAGLELAMQVQADALCAESAEDRARLALTFHRISRSIRQTAALRMRIARVAAQAGREASVEVVKLDAVRLARRKAQVRAGVQRLIWTEHEASEDEDLRHEITEDLDALLDLESQDDETFLDTAPEALVAQLAERLGLAAGGADPSKAAGPPGDSRGREPWRSSA